MCSREQVGCCGTTGDDDTDSVPHCRGSAVAVHRPGHRTSCLDAEADPNGANDAEDHRYSSLDTVKRRSVFVLGRLSRGYTGAGGAENSGNFHKTGSLTEQLTFDDHAETSGRPSR